jgi:hypothetical protein
MILSRIPQFHWKLKTSDDERCQRNRTSTLIHKLFTDAKVGLRSIYYRGRELDRTPPINLSENHTLKRPRLSGNEVWSAVRRDVEADCQWRVGLTSIARLIGDDIRDKVLGRGGEGEEVDDREERRDLHVWLVGGWLP